MNDKKIISSSKHAFTKGKSCLTNLTSFYSEWIKLIGDRNAVNTVFLGFSKAFNILPIRFLDIHS